MNDNEKMKLFQRKLQKHDFDIDNLFKEAENLQKRFLEVLNHHEKLVKTIENVRDGEILLKDNVFKNSVNIDKIERRLK